MDKKKFNEIVLDAKKYRPDEYQTFKAEQYQAFKDGRSWADWMDEYVDYEDDNEVMHHEEIEKIMKKAFDDAHNIRYTYTLLSVDMKPAFDACPPYENTEQFETIEELKKDIEKYGNVNYRIYSIDENSNFEEIETIENV